MKLWLSVFKCINSIQEDHMEMDIEVKASAFTLWDFPLVWGLPQVAEDQGL